MLRANAVKLNNSMTNDVYLQDGKIYRMFGKGTDEFINRQQEERIMIYAAMEGIGPHIISIHKEYRVEEWLNNSLTLTNEQLRDPTILHMVIDHLRTLHNINIESLSKKPVLINRIHKWSELAGITVPDDLIANLPKSPIVLAHNDLVCCNILLRQEKIYFIDYEYAGYNYLAAELAEMFNQLETNQNDKTMIPPVELKHILQLEYYACLWYCSNNKQYAHQLYQTVKAYQPVLDFVWACWAKARGYHDYYEKRWDQYLTRKKMVARPR